MSIADKITRLQTAKTNIATAITSKGGSVAQSDGFEDFPNDISTIKSAIDVSTSAQMDANLVAENNGKMYHYTGTTTDKYVNGRYYIVKAYDTRIDLTQYGTNYVFEDSNVLTLDQTKYFGAYQSTNYHVRSSNSIARIYTKSPKLVVWINSYAEAYADYSIASTVDRAVYPIIGSQQKGDTSAFQKNPRGGLNTTYWKRVEYTTADGLTDNDTEHYVWIVYKKDNSTDSYDDRGYFVVEKPIFYKEFSNINGNITITDTSIKDVSEYKTAQVVDANLSPEYIKKDVNILGVVGIYEGGGGGGSGYNLSYTYRFGGQNSCSLTLNGSAYTYPLSNYAGTGGIAYVNMPSVSKLKVGGDGSYRSDCIVEFTSGGTTRSLNFGEEVELTEDSSLYIYENSCLAGDTLITMSDGSEKFIKSIKVGDKILSYNPQTLEIEEDEVIDCDSNKKKIHTEYDLWEFEQGYIVRTVNKHRFYNVERQAMVYMNEWDIGEHTITKDGNQVALLKHTNIQQETRHFTLFTKNQNYFANGMLSGNRETLEMHIGNYDQKLVTSKPSEVEVLST